MKKKKQVQLIGSIISVIILLFLIFLTNVDTSKYSYLEALQNKIAFPFRKAAISIKKRSRNEKKKKEYFDLTKLQEENSKLLEENIKLKEIQRKQDMLVAENKELNEKLNLKNRYNQYTSMPASIIHRNSNNFSEHAIIDIGLNEGVEEGMAVVAESGLYGRIISVSDTSSKVELIIDPASQFSIKAQNRSESYICKSSLDKKRRLIATLIPMETNLLKGEIIRTSKLGLVFPEGILVGKIEEMSVSKNLSDKYAVIHSDVDFDNTTNVLVLANRK